MLTKGVLYYVLHSVVPQYILKLTACVCFQSVVSPSNPEDERRPLKYSLPGDPYGICDITDVPKGKLSIVEALNALNNHKRNPQTWTLEKVAKEYSLDLKDTQGLLTFFIPFEVKILPPKKDAPQQIKDT